METYGSTFFQRLRVDPAQIANFLNTRPPKPTVLHYFTSYLPSTWSIMAFCACNRFSACGKTIEFGASITSSVTSTPLSAGKQCMKYAFGPAISIRLRSTCKMRLLFHGKYYQPINQSKHATVFVNQIVQYPNNSSFFVFFKLYLPTQPNPIDSVAIIY